MVLGININTVNDDIWKYIIYSMIVNNWLHMNILKS